MQIDWLKTIEDIFGEEVTCPRCDLPTSQLVAGYSRESSAAEYAPRHQDCADKDHCEARKLVFLCQNCAKELRLRARPVNQEGMMTLLIQDCRKDLEDCLDYLAEYWQEDLDVDPENSDSRLEDVAPDVFKDESELRVGLEEEYLDRHHWFREHKIRIPDPEWRSQYAEDIIALGYSAILGD